MATNISHTLISNSASDVLQTFEKLLSFFQNVGILQSYAFSTHCNVFFSSTADELLNGFIVLLEEIKIVLDKLKEVHKTDFKQKQYENTDFTSNSHNLEAAPSTADIVPVDLISASHFIQTTEMFVAEQLITSQPEQLITSQSEQLIVSQSEQLVTPQPPQLITPQPQQLIPDDVGSYMTTSGLLNNDYIVPEISNEHGTQSSWAGQEEKDDQEDQEKENVEKVSPEVDEKFQCAICNKLLRSKTSLNFHQAMHEGQKPFCCEHCGKLFTTSVNLAAHLTRQHNLNTESANPCKECGKLFVRRSALQQHMKRHMGFKPWACALCEKSFTQKVTRDTHQLTHTRDYRFNCDDCGKKFPTQAKLNYHSKTHGEPLFMCNLCDKVFSIKQYLDAHYKTHNIQAHCGLDTVNSQAVENAIFSCSQCNKSFHSQDTLTIHLQRHNTLSSRYGYLEKQKMVSRQKHPCDICGKEFLLKSSLFHHRRQKHSSSTSDSHLRPFKCQLCPKTFTLQKKAKRHMLCHNQPVQSQHACALCGRLFNRKDSLYRHMAIHEPPSFVCAVCGHGSPNQLCHSEHMKTHANIIKCTHPGCEKAFKSKTALDFHLSSHEGKFKFQCNICGKQFVRKCHYRGHLLSHSTDRPYKCDTCGKGFKDNKTCREHCKRVHPVLTILPPPGDQISTNPISAPDLLANEMDAREMDIQSLLQGDDATYGQTYDQFQACVQLQ